MAYSVVCPLIVFGSMAVSICPSANNSSTVWSRIFARERRPKGPRIIQQGLARNGKHCSCHPWMSLYSTRVGEADPRFGRPLPAVGSTTSTQWARTNASRSPEYKRGWMHTNERDSTSDEQHRIIAVHLMEYSTRPTSTSVCDPVNVSVRPVR